MSQSDNSFFKTALLAFRQKQSITQRQACEKYGIPLSTWRTWEQGVSCPTVSNDNFELLRDMFSEVPCVAVPEGVIEPAKQLQDALAVFLESAKDSTTDTQLP